MTLPRKSSIYYLVPDLDGPSWGLGLLYHHVHLLRQAGFEAFVLHERSPFRLTWLDLDVPIRYRDEAAPHMVPSDVLVAPEVWSHTAARLPYPCRRVIFVQGSFLILREAESAFDYRELGYEAALAVLPHAKDIVAAHFGLIPTVVPPLIAPYFFCDDLELDRPRRRQVLLVSKPGYLQAGYLDRDIVGKLLVRHFERLNRSSEDARWEIIELSGYTHRQTAELMKRATLLVNLNTLEAFNTTVPEAMAAGCIPVCYEAFGGRDFLHPGANAFVFPNNHVYPLLDKLMDLTANFEEHREELSALRRRARATAESYSEESTARALVEFFRSFVA